MTRDEWTGGIDGVIGSAHKVARDYPVDIMFAEKGLTFLLKRQGTVQAIFALKPYSVQASCEHEGETVWFNPFAPDVIMKFISG